MAKEREKELFWVGPMHPVTGEPLEWFSGIPATDLDETTINHLTDEDYELAIGSKFYQKSKPSGEKAKEAAPSADKGKEG